MQKLKRIRKWNCLNENCNSNNSCNKMTSSTLTTASATMTNSSSTANTKQHSLARNSPNWAMVELKEIVNHRNDNKCSPNEKSICSIACKTSNNSISNKYNDTSLSVRKSHVSIRNQHSSLRIRSLIQCCCCFRHKWLILCVALSVILQNFTIMGSELHVEASTKPMQPNVPNIPTTTNTTTPIPLSSDYHNKIITNAAWLYKNNNKTTHTQYNANADDSIFLRFAKRFSTGNDLWDGLITDCYKHPTFSCFQKNVYSYLTGVLDANDVNVTQRLKFYKNHVDFEEYGATTEAAVAMDHESNENFGMKTDNHLLKNEIPQRGRAVAETPIEEVTNALYGKSIKFAMTHDIELKLPEMMFDGATFRISPRSIEGNGIIAKLELIPKQEVQARLAGKIIMKKIQKFLRSKLLLSFIALLLIIKIIKIKLFWLLPIVIGVGAAKKLLLKFLLFLFPALSHLFKLCSYYQQTYHATKYHHHHHHINHHHTVVPAWHSSGEHHSIPEIIYTNPPKGHPSAYLHGAPIHETYGPPLHEHFDNWESSGPGLGSEYISDINRAAQLDENTNLFKPNANDASELNAWGLGTTQTSFPLNKNPQQHQQRLPTSTQQQRPPTIQKQTTLSIQQPQFYKKPQVTSHNFNPFINPDKPSVFNVKYKNPAAAQSAASPVYVPPRNQQVQQSPPPQQPVGGLAAQIAAQYDPARNNIQQQQQLTPELSAQIKEAIRVQAEQRIIQQQQKILEKQPFVLDGGQPLMPKNYDPFYSPILLKIDKIIEQLGITDELCKERLVCSMYKDPQRYSPHSNFVSAELSRDTSELQQPANTNEAVVRFYRLIEAARDGQDQRDCLSLYPQCKVNTE